MNLIRNIALSLMLLSAVEASVEEDATLAMETSAAHQASYAEELFFAEEEKKEEERERFSDAKKDYPIALDDYLNECNGSPDLHRKKEHLLETIESLRKILDADILGQQIETVAPLSDIAMVRKSDVPEGEKTLYVEALNAYLQGNNSDKNNLSRAIEKFRTALQDNFTFKCSTQGNPTRRANSYATAFASYINAPYSPTSVESITVYLKSIRGFLKVEDVEELCARLIPSGKNFSTSLREILTTANTLQQRLSAMSSTDKNDFYREINNEEISKVGTNTEEKLMLLIQRTDYFSKLMTFVEGKGNFFTELSSMLRALESIRIFMNNEF